MSTFLHCDHDNVDVVQQTFILIIILLIVYEIIFESLMRSKFRNLNKFEKKN